MNTKIIIYIIVIPIVMYVLESLNINGIFKKNRVVQARLFYLIATICISYLVVSFIYDILSVVKIGGVI